MKPQITPISQMLNKNKNYAPQSYVIKLVQLVVNLVFNIRAFVAK